MNQQTNIMEASDNLNVSEYATTTIKKLIYTIRGKQVMLDSDVAMLYHYQTKRINETVSRNKERFPENFCFQLTENELKELELQISILNEQEYPKNQSIMLTEDINMRSQFATAPKNK